MVQKSLPPVEVDSLSHYLQGFIAPSRVVRCLGFLVAINRYVTNRGNSKTKNHLKSLGLGDAESGLSDEARGVGVFLMGMGCGTLEKQGCWLLLFLPLLLLLITYYYYYLFLLYLLYSILILLLIIINYYYILLLLLLLLLASPSMFSHHYF